MPPPAARHGNRADVSKGLKRLRAISVFCNIHYPLVDRYLEQVLNFTSQQDGSEVLNSSSDVNRIISELDMSVT